ncbi:MAG: SOS response-associated peptidase [Acidimicrobiales bacterium]
MCGRYTSVTSVAALARFFAVDEVVTGDVGLRHNVAPTQDVPAVAEASGGRRLGQMRWGLVPPGARDPGVGSRMINARAETVSNKPAFRRAFEHRRCLIPADGFYEWQARGDGAVKQPWYIRHRDGTPMAFAGLWERWRPGPHRHDGVGHVVSCTIVTTSANRALAPVHHRMPVVLAPACWEAWLDLANHDTAALRSLLAPAPDELFERVRVRTLVNSVANDGPGLVEPLDSVQLDAMDEGARQGTIGEGPSPRMGARGASSDPGGVPTHG